jgi:hypothetical protein
MPCSGGTGMIIEKETTGKEHCQEVRRKTEQGDTEHKTKMELTTNHYPKSRDLKWFQNCLEPVTPFQAQIVIIVFLSLFYHFILGIWRTGSLSF